MLTAEDIKKLMEAQKEFFYNKEEMDSKLGTIETKINDVQTSVDSFAKDVKKFDGQLTTEIHRVTRLEEWAKPAAKKLDIPLAL